MHRWPELQFGSWNTSGAAHGARETASVVQLIEALNNEATRERALHLLSKIFKCFNAVPNLDPQLRWDDILRAIREELAPLLWHSVGTISILLQEIISVYHLLYTPTLTERASNRVCDALVLFQCVATNPSTKMQFIEAKLPMYLYPFLNNTNKDRPHEFLRLTSLGVIGALAKADDPNVINFLLESEVFPCCLRCMEVGNELSKTVATYIVYKILINEEGLRYCCTVAERFYALVRVLGNMIQKLAEEGKLAEDPSKRLLKHIIWCYHRLSESPRSCDGLRCCLPVILSDTTFIDMFRGDPSAMQRLHQLFQNVSNRTSRIQPIEQLIGPLVRG